jgi:hypothetical protein
MCSCKRDNTNESSPCHTFKTTFVNLEPVFKTVLPYTGKETIKYLKNNTDTLTFVGQGEESGYECYDDSYAPVCPPDSKCAQYFKYRFIEKNNIDSFSIYLYRNVYVTGFSNLASNIFSLNSNANKYYCSLDFIGNSCRNNFLDSLQIKKYKFYNISFVSVDNINNNDSNNYIYVNKLNGVVYLKNVNTTYTLIK